MENCHVLSWFRAPNTTLTYDIVRFIKTYIQETLPQLVGLSRCEE